MREDLNTQARGTEESPRQLDNGPVVPTWRVLCKIGGVAAMILLAYSLVTMVVLIVIGGQPGTADEAFTLLKDNRLIALLRLDLLTVAVIPLYYLLFGGLCVALVRSHAAYTALAAVLAFSGITLFLSTPSVFSMVYLGDQYMAATTEVQRTLLLAAGEAILASDMWHSTGAIVGGILIQISALLVSVVMLQGKVFSRATAYVGILTHGLDLAHILVGLFAPVGGVVLMAVAGPLYLIWFPLVGLRLLQLGRPGGNVYVDRS
jgi:hypothetical protein